MRLQVRVIHGGHRNRVAKTLVRSKDCENVEKDGSCLREEIEERFRGMTAQLMSYLSALTVFHAACMAPNLQLNPPTPIHVWNERLPLMHGVAEY
jgi:hypothetical protein